MQNKKQILVIGILVLIVGAAAFIGARMLNGEVNPLGLFGRNGKTQTEILPAEKLPKTPPAAEGLFVERQDNRILVQTNQQPVTGAVGEASSSPADPGGGPEVEVVITTQTIIYRDTTQVNPDQPSATGRPAVQQPVGEGTLDDLNSEVPVIVWGRRNGERIIAEVLLYGSPTKLQKPKP